MLPCSFESTTAEVEHPWCLSSHGVCLGILGSTFLSFDLRDAFQCVNSVVRLARYNGYSRYRGFYSL